MMYKIYFNPSKLDYFLISQNNLREKIKNIWMITLGELLLAILSLIDSYA